MKQGFAVIDVNLPKHVSELDDRQEHDEADAIENRTREATRLLSYLWDNYIELNDSTHVFLMGTNTGHGAIINFIKANEERAQERLAGAISFVEDVTLQSCKSATNDFLAQWYYSISQVFVALDHNFWFSDLAKKLRKRFGKVNKSSQETITDMLIEHKEAVLNLLLENSSDWRRQRIRDQEIVMDTSLVDLATTPRRMPPIGNFAPSATVRAGAGNNLPDVPPIGNLASPRGQRARSPRVGSPPKLPPLGNFAFSPRQRSSRSPAR